VAALDLNRFKGQWYEIAHLPRSTQVDCTGTTANYAVTGPTTLILVHQCFVGSLTGPLRQVAANGVVSDPSAPAKLSVDFGGFYGDYWVIDLGAQYEYAVVGHPSRDYLWILSRTSTLDATTLAGITSRAQSEGFDVSKLQYTEQPDQAPIGSADAGAIPVTPPSYGCGSRVGPRVAPWGAVLGAFAAVVAGAYARRRRRSPRAMAPRQEA